jgi:hypothetical protein
MSKVIAAGATALFACNSPLASLLARGKRVVVRGQRVTVIGRPLTPMSVAGVNRRAHRRAYRRDYYGYGAYANPYRYGYGTYQPYGGYAYQPWWTR